MLIMTDGDDDYKLINDLLSHRKGNTQKGLANKSWNDKSQNRCAFEIGDLINH